jgi:hypothetical protein
MSRRKRATPKRGRRRPGRGSRRSTSDIPGGETTGLLSERLSHPETSPALSGGDIDADWTRAQSSGEEAPGGSVMTPDQDVVDEIGRALGVEQAADAEVRASGEILEARDRHYWHLERRAADQDPGA